MSPPEPTRELTIRGLILGALITVVFTASNTYLGLKIGLTFASSIPAAVISMAALRDLGGGPILDNNTVQSHSPPAPPIPPVFAAFPPPSLLPHSAHSRLLDTP